MPFYTDSVLDEVRNSVNIVSLISEYVALKKRGRNHVARCPFHTEKTPSFNVNEEKQIFHCFGCGVGGDVFKFVMQIEHLTFPEAVRFLAERYGIALPQRRQRVRIAETGSDTEVAAQGHGRRPPDFSTSALLDSEEGRTALDYLQGRGVSRGYDRPFQAGLFARRTGRRCSHGCRKREFRRRPSRNAGWSSGPRTARATTTLSADGSCFPSRTCADESSLSAGARWGITSRSI